MPEWTEVVLNIRADSEFRSQMFLVALVHALPLTEGYQFQRIYIKTFCSDSITHVESRNDLFTRPLLVWIWAIIRVQRIRGCDRNTEARNCYLNYKHLAILGKNYKGIVRPRPSYNKQSAKERCTSFSFSCPMPIKVTFIHSFIHLFVHSFIH